jgi:hypothetical protein
MRSRVSCGGTVGEVRLVVVRVRTLLWNIHKPWS